MAENVGSSRGCRVFLSKTVPATVCGEEMRSLLLGACACISWYDLSLYATASRHQGMTCPEKEGSPFPPLLCASLNHRFTSVGSFLLADIIRSIYVLIISREF